MADAEPHARRWLSAALLASAPIAVGLGALFSLAALPLRGSLGVDGLAAARVVAAAVGAVATLSVVFHELRRQAAELALVLPWRAIARFVGLAGLPPLAGLAVALAAALWEPTSAGVVVSWSQSLPTGALAALGVGTAMGAAERLSDWAPARWVALAGVLAVALAAVASGHVVRGALDPGGRPPWEVTGEAPKPP